MVLKAWKTYEVSPTFLEKNVNISIITWGGARTEPAIFINFIFM